jgi:hypothetical protein
MKRLLGVLFLVVLPLWCQAAESGRSPNFLLIFTDDHGYGDVSTYQASDVRTPHIDRLAADGMLFTAMRANCTVCSPSRAALLTGRYADRVGVPGVIRTHPENSWGYFDPSVPTMADELEGRRLSHGDCRQVASGAGIAQHAQRTRLRLFPRVPGRHDGQLRDAPAPRQQLHAPQRGDDRPEGHATDSVLRLGRGLPARAKRSSPTSRSFLYWPTTRRIFPSSRLRNGWSEVKQRAPEMDEKRARNVAFVEHPDDGIGRVLAALERDGAGTRNTLVVFTADNGGSLPHAQNNDPWRDGKQSHYDGGLRVPFMVRWPGTHRGRRAAITRAGVRPVSDVSGTGRCGRPGRSRRGQPGSRVPRRDDHGAARSVLRAPRRRHGLRRQELRSDHPRRWKLLQNDPYSPLELYNLKDDPQDVRIRISCSRIRENSDFL